MANPPDSDPPTLWRFSAFDRVNDPTATPDGLSRQTLLATTLQAELRALERRPESTDVLEVVAACLRTREAALLYLRFDDLLWPVTVFPAERIYHSPRSLARASELDLQKLHLQKVEPPIVRPPGHLLRERIARPEQYYPLNPAVWRLALYGPRAGLLAEIGGTAAYRTLRDSTGDGLNAPGAMGAAIRRLRNETTSMREIAKWPGMSIQRAAAMLNALYLCGNLLVSRTNPAARPEPGLLGRWMP